MTGIDRAGGGRSLRRRVRGALARVLLWGAAAVTVGLLAFLICYILYRGVPELSWDFLTGEESVLRGTDGIWPAVLNTLYVVVVTLLVVLPLGVGAAVYLTEYARNRRLVAAIEFANETLAGIPSILYAMVGVLVFCQALNLKKTLLAGALTMVIMTLPTIIRTTQEALKTVPRSYREGALGLGAGKWHMIRTVVLPGAMDGILSGCILTVGRIVGESAVLLFTAGMATGMQDFSSWAGLTQSSGATLTVALYVYVKERAQYDKAFAVAVVLLAVTLAVDMAAKLVGGRLRKK